jgi:hypothetical protein
MALKLHLRWAMRAALLIAACLAPSMASAHAGHSHAPTTAQSAPAAEVDANAVQTAVVILAEVTNATPIWTGVPVSACASHCCSGHGGMTCCTAALTPETSTAPDFSGVYCLLLTQSGPLPGLVPEALPKPPKSFG